MNQEEKEALNISLAYHAGFTRIEDGYPVAGWHPQYHERQYLQFTDSFDRCFKFLIKDNWGIVFYYKLSTFEVSITPTDSIMSYHGEGATREIALCLAIERVYDSMYV